MPKLEHKMTGVKLTSTYALGFGCPLIRVMKSRFIKIRSSTSPASSCLNEDEHGVCTPS